MTRREILEDQLSRGGLTTAEMSELSWLRLNSAPDEPTDDEIYNRVTGPHTGVEGGIAYDTTADQPGSLGENDWRL
jgi:hypothetical protein